MTKKEYIEVLDTLITTLKEDFEKCKEDDYMEKMRVLGRINGLLQAKIWACELEK